jgi:hypothetical protein
MRALLGSFNALTQMVDDRLIAPIRGMEVRRRMIATRWK